MVNRKWTRLGIVLLAGVVGCAVESEPPASDQTTEIRDDNGNPIPLDPERKLALEMTHMALRKCSSTNRSSASVESS